MKTGWSIIGVSGCTNSGKTTLATEIQKHFQGSVVVKQDDFFRSDDSKEHVLVPELNHKNWERLESVDWEAMMTRLKEIISSPPPNKPAMLIVDGHIMFNHPKLRQLFHKKYFITMEKDECYRRRILRQYEPPDVPGYFELVVWPMYLENLEDVRAHCSDVMYFDGTSDVKKIQDTIIADIKSYINEH